jgi:ribosome-binding protein aMBF1 (putative translation factor)
MNCQVDDLAELLRQARWSKGLTMLAAAERLKIPIPIYKLIESGKLCPNPARLKIISDFIGLDSLETAP